MDRPMLAFEPMSCAILCALCRPKYLATAPRMRVWLRRSSESVREALRSILPCGRIPMLTKASCLCPWLSWPYLQRCTSGVGWVYYIGVIHPKR